MRRVLAAAALLAVLGLLQNTDAAASERMSGRDQAAMASAAIDIMNIELGHWSQQFHLYAQPYRCAARGRGWMCPLVVHYADNTWRVWSVRVREGRDHLLGPSVPVPSNPWRASSATL